MKKIPFTPWQHALGAVLALALVGCRNPHKNSGEPVVLLAPEPLPPTRQPNVWHPDEVAPYVLGRYVDPRDPNMVHESHLVYRREKSSRPNLTPPAMVVLPSSEVAGPSAAHVLQFYRDALTAELNAQRTTSEEIIEQSRQLQHSVGTLNEQAQSLRQSVEEAARLRSQWQDLTGRVDQLERRLREAQAPAETPQSNASAGWFRR